MFERLRPPQQKWPKTREEQQTLLAAVCALVVSTVMIYMYVASACVERTFSHIRPANGLQMSLSTRHCALRISVCLSCAGFTAVCARSGL